MSIFAQYGAGNVFSFVDIEVSPKIESIGGNGIALYDNDVLLSRTTPSLLNNSMNNNIAFAFSDYFADINILSFSYARNIKNIGFMSFHIQAINYGTFDETDEYGNINGVFSAYDQLIAISYAKKISNFFTIGANINLLNSYYSDYSSFAITSNLSTTYFHAQKEISSTVLIKNIGRQINFYNQQEDIPFQIQWAISKKLAYLPFKYHIAYTHLQNFDISSPYKLNTFTNVVTGNLEIQEENMFKTSLRHFIIGGELNPFNKSLFLRGGFNFQRRFDMSLQTSSSMVGFSWGVGFNVANFGVNYSRSLYHLSAIPNNFSIVTNINTFAF